MTSTSWGSLPRCHRSHLGIRDNPGTRRTSILWSIVLLAFVTLPWSINAEPGKHLSTKCLFVISMLLLVSAVQSFDPNAALQDWSACDYGPRVYCRNPVTAFLCNKMDFCSGIYKFPSNPPKKVRPKSG